MRRLSTTLICIVSLSSCAIDENGLAPASNTSKQDSSSSSSSGTVSSSGGSAGGGGASVSSSGGSTTGGGGGAGGQPPCHPIGLEDGFDGAAVNTSLWNLQGKQSIMSVTNSQLHVTPEENIDDGQWVGLVTKTRYNLTNCAVWIEAPSIVKNGSAGNTYWQLYTPNGSSAIRVANGMLEADVSDMNGSVDKASITYVAAEHRWWRIRETAGKLILEASPNFITWTTLLTVATPPYITQVSIGLGVISPSNETSLGKTTFDNFNILP